METNTSIIIPEGWEVLGASAVLKSGDMAYRTVLGKFRDIKHYRRQFEPNVRMVKHHTIIRKIKEGKEKVEIVIPKNKMKPLTQEQFLNKIKRII